jgi:hypothetical protein
LDSSRFKVIGELKDILIRLSSKPKVFYTINIIIVDILEAYGMFLKKDYSKKLNGYFAIAWSHLWLPCNEKENQIHVEHERYMKHIVIELEEGNEPIIFTDSILGNYYVDNFLGNFPIDVSPYAKTTIQSELMFYTQVPKIFE